VLQLLELLELLGKGILLGLGAAAPIGPVNVEIARRSLRNGFTSGASVGFGAVTVDVFYAILTGVGLRPLLDRSWFYQPMRYASIALLLFLAIMCFVGAVRAMRADLIDQQPPRRSVSSGYVTGMLPGC
jgi:L-lysine exporter family protein LysE/ArgO